MNCSPSAALERPTLERAAWRYAHDIGIWQEFKGIGYTPWLEIRYEVCVTHLERDARRALEFLQLPWDPQALGYRDRLKTKTVKSPTDEAVSQQLYTSAIGRWTNCGNHLEPFWEILKRCINAFGYSRIQKSALWHDHLLIRACGVAFRLIHAQKVIPRANLHLEPPSPSTIIGCRFHFWHHRQNIHSSGQATDHSWNGAR